ncbi:hypothetical protein C2I36_07070 [Rhodobacteraceae bacterium WD3A24]|nr:hypothetical protein C2I36_07070 [Rhodobacteraceae bacterium WD3A24]
MKPLRLAAAALAALSISLPALAQVPARWERAWPETDFSQSAVDFDEIISGGPGKDGIPALTGPEFIPVAEEDRIAPREPVMVVDLDGAAPRAYPIRYLMWHEIVNDTVAGTPVAVTFCPLCNTGIVFDRRVGDEVLEFGVSGLLRHSDMIMYDRLTESWWQQATGEGIVGDYTGTRLTVLASVMEGWSTFRDANPDGLVMDEPDWPRGYGSNPYGGYDSAQRPFLFRGEMPPHGINPMARVVRVGERAWPLTRLREAGRIEEAGLTLTWEEGQASALDSRAIGQGREVGTVRVREDSGERVVFDLPFAFAFHAFHPDGEWMLSE